MPRMLATRALLAESRPPIFRYFKSSMKAHSRTRGTRPWISSTIWGAVRAPVPHLHRLLHQKAQGEGDVEGIGEVDIGGAQDVLGHGGGLEGAAHFGGDEQAHHLITAVYKGLEILLELGRGDLGRVGQLVGRRQLLVKVLGGQVQVGPVALLSKIHGDGQHLHAQLRAALQAQVAGAVCHDLYHRTSAFRKKNSHSCVLSPNHTRNRGGGQYFRL